MYYAVVKGTKTGIFSNWNEVKDYVNFYADPQYKGFKTIQEARNYYNRFAGKIKDREDYINYISRITDVRDGEKYISKKSPSLHSQVPCTIYRNKNDSKFRPNTVARMDEKKVFKFPVNNQTKLIYKKSEKDNQVHAFPMSQRLTGKKKSFIKVIKKSDTKGTNEACSSSTSISNTEVNSSKARVFGTYKNLQIFTDGSTFNNGKKNAVGGYGVHFEPPILEDISEKYEDGEATNQKCELMAAYAGLKAVNSNSETMSKENINQVTIYTDSKYTMNCIDSWISNWRKNNWQTSKGTDVKNKDLIRLLDAEFSKSKAKYNINFRYVKAHTGRDDKLSKGNDIADKLARNGSNSCKN